MMNHEALVTALGIIGFSVTKDDINSTRLTNESQGLTMFVMKSKGRRDSKIAKRLVIHPDFQDRLDALSRIPGIILKGKPERPFVGYYSHHTTFSPFPKRLHKGKKPISYGISMHVESSGVLPSIVRLLTKGDVFPHQAINDTPEKTGSRSSKVNSGSGARTLAEDLSSASEDFQGLTSTERAVLINARVGQGLFRKRLISYWGACSVTLVSDVRLLRASHIKPWRNCDNDERLDAFNGLLLTPGYDHCFDMGLISFADDGRVLIAGGSGGAGTLAPLGISPAACLTRVDPRHLPYLRHHRAFHGF